MTECTVYLHCVVNGWEYQKGTLNSESSSDERLISLSGLVEHRGFIERMPFDFRLVSGLCTSNIPELSDTNILEINEPMPEYEFPESLSALIPIEEAQLEDLRDNLIQLATNKAMSLSVTLSVDGLMVDRLDNDRIVTTEGQKMNISSFIWNLSYNGSL